MSVQFRNVTDNVYEIHAYDSDIILSFQSSGAVEIPVDNGSIPIGFQTAVQASSAPVVVKANDGVTLACPVPPFIKPYQTGVMVKTDANFWLLSLGTSGGSGGAVPLPPDLINISAGPGSLTVTWAASLDPGGSPITNHIVEISEDNLIWSVDQIVGADDTTATISGLIPSVYWVRVKALNNEGASDPSNVLSATPLVSTITGKHTALREFTITNYTTKYTYTVVSGAADLSKLPKVILPAATAPNQSVAQIKAEAGGISDTITFYAKPYTYTTSGPQCNSVSYQCRGDCPGSNCSGCYDKGCKCACTYYPSGECAGLYGYQTCDCYGCPTNKDATPSGYVDEYGEWAKITDD
jgi:hypothetical protein